MSNKTIRYNEAQALFIASQAKIRILEWGRGTGKSTILGRYIYDCVTQMPRSKGVLVAETYRQILTRTLPSTIAGLQQHGLYKDQHFFVGKRPPKRWNWPEAYEPPLDYKRCMIFWNGCTIEFLSQDESAGSGRGMNIDFALGDEAVRLNYDKYKTDVLLCLRGGLNNVAKYPNGRSRLFRECPLHHSIVLASTTPVTSNGQWFVKYEDQARLNPEKVNFIKASAYVNRHNLGKEWFETNKIELPDFMYDAEVRNIRITKVKDGFYPSLNESIHTYNSFNYETYEEAIEEGKDADSVKCLGDADLRLDDPLTIGVDWGSSINCLVVNQYQDGVEKIIKAMYVKSPKIIDHLMNDFADYYAAHRNKIVYFWYDPTGNLSVANSKITYAEQAAKILKARGWQVYKMTQGNHNVPHLSKHNLWNKLLDEGNKEYPNVRFNRSNCRELWISMTTAPAKQGKNEAIKKDKSSEGKKGVDQAHATHFSDAADVIMVGKHLNKLLMTQEHIDVRLTR
jgi:hypothetical protein